MSEEFSVSVVKPQPKGWGVIAGTFWALLAYTAPQYLLWLLLPLALSFGLSQNTMVFVAQAFIQLLTAGMIIAVIFAYRLNLQSIGFGLLRWRQLGTALFAFPIYLAATTLVAAALGLLLSPELLEQTQELPFESPQGIELLLVFVALVVITPLVEEMIFRGFLYRAFGRKFGMILGAVLVSILFGVAHGQLNVGVDTFILSLFLCYIRVKTDSIWAPIFLHALKNLVAFYILFIMGVKS